MIPWTDMKEYAKKYTAITILSMVVVLIIGIGLGWALLSSDAPSPGEESSLSLPTTAEVSEETPVLYDFVHSAISYKIDVDEETLGNWGYFYAVMINNNEVGTFWVEYYVHAEQLTFPTLGTEPVKIEVTDETWQVIQNQISQLPESRVFREGDWTMYIITNGPNLSNEPDAAFCESWATWSGIDFTQYVDSEAHGAMYYVVYGNEETEQIGTGYPVEWLRKEPYTTLLLSAGYDITDTFWDCYNPMQTLVFYSATDSEDYVTVTVVDLDYFAIPADGSTANVHEEEMISWLEHKGYVYKVAK